VYWGTTLPFNFLTQKIAERRAPTPAVVENKEQNSSTQVADTEPTTTPAAQKVLKEEPAPAPQPQEVVKEEPAPNPQTQTVVKEEPVPTEPQEAIVEAPVVLPNDVTTEQNTTNATVDNGEIRVAKIDSNGQSESVDNAVTPEPQVLQEVQTDSLLETSFIIKNYRATMFSDPSSADATETPIARGASVEVLERVGSWVLIAEFYLMAL